MSGRTPPSQPLSIQLDGILESHDIKRELNKPSLNRYFTKNRLEKLITNLLEGCLPEKLERPPLNTETISYMKAIELQNATIDHIRSNLNNKLGVKENE